MSEDRLSHSLKIVGAIVGAVVGTIGLCGVIPQTWGVFGWTISLISLIRALATRRRVTSYADTPSIIWRVVLASVFTFCLIFLAAMATAGASNPQAIGQVEQYLALAMIFLGVSSAGAAVWLAWK